MAESETEDRTGDGEPLPPVPALDRPATVLRDAWQRRVAIIPFCFAFRSVIVRHPGYRCLVPARWQQHLLSAPGPGLAAEEIAAAEHIRFTGSPARKPSAALQPV
ncbi:hypothetical protein [Paeniglutamicibacter psychrophenolicus]|uniref:hypothetical protein n=1 Tax=Paeniglutamicibacter psychrophenolicus TaxID=257454 RepID=UPI00277F72D6|nr:hypothetical protein [Paeniglutamicibacter psychrophenolicus]MDQ0096172.1 hypothetical protein [Paeniglutamicibacter psychrophenolicus]